MIDGSAHKNAIVALDKDIKAAWKIYRQSQLDASRNATAAEEEALYPAINEALFHLDNAIRVLIEGQTLCDNFRK
jgi:hypothetical protein